MTFLAMTPLQAVLLAVITSGVVIALYFLKLRHRRVFISSSLLWHRVLQDQQAHSLWEKLRKIVSIVVAVLIALLIALSLARPQVEALTGSSERVVIVLDTSPTMATRTQDGRTRWQHAVDEANSILDSGGPTTEFLVVDTLGLTTTGFNTNRNELRQVIQGMSPKAAPAKFPGVDPADSVVYFISDGVAVSDVPEFAKRVSVFEPASNIGITAFDIRSVPAAPLAYEAYLELQNYSPEAARAELTLTSAGGQKISRTLNLRQDEAYNEILDLSRFDGGQVLASIDYSDDALALDNTAYGYLPVKRKTKTLLVTRGNEYLEKFLRLDTYVDVSVVSPEQYSDRPDTDVYIFDRYAPAAAPSKPALIIGAPDASWLRPKQGTVQKPEFKTWMEQHPIMRSVPVHDIAIQQAARIDATGLNVIASSDQTPLIVTSDQPRWAMLTFELSSSDFPFHVGFPIFIENVLGWFNRESLAESREPGRVEIPIRNAEIKTMDGTPVASYASQSQTAFEAFEPGLFTASGTDSSIHVAVNVSNRAYSDVNRSDFKSDEVTLGGTFLRHELWFYMLTAAVILIAAEWFTYHRRITL